MLKKLTLSFFINIIILYIITPSVAFYIYNIGIANTNFIQWFNGLGIQFELQTPIITANSSGLEYIIRPMAFVVCFVWICIESVIIIISTHTLLDNLFSLQYTNTSFIRLRLIVKIVLKHTLLLIATLGIPNFTGFYYPDLFAFYIYGMMIIFDICMIIISKGQYSGLNYIFRLKYKKNDPKVIES